MLPDRGFERRADFIEGKGLVGMFDVGGYFGVDEGEFTGFIGVYLEDAEEFYGWNAEGTDCVPNTNCFDWDFGAGESFL